jgi:sulfide:quinone oxidoreductase
VPEQTILVLGCGMAGVVAARELRRHLPRGRIVAIDRAPRVSYAPSYPALALAHIHGGAIQRSRAHLARKGVEFVNATVQQVDVSNRLVRAEGRELRYDYLVLALGAELAPELTPGLTEAAQGFYTFDAAERLAASLRYFAGGRILISVPEGPVKWPAAPYELAMLLEHDFHVKKMRQKVEIAVQTPEQTPLEAFGPEVSELIAGQLAHKGIEFAGASGLRRVGHARHSAELDNGGERPFDLLVAIPRHVAPPVAVEAGLADESGWITVDPETMQTGHENVFAAGDVARLGTPGARTLMSGGIARAEAELAARQIASRIEGGRAPSPPTGNSRCFIEVGAGASIMVSGDFIHEPGRLRAAQPSIVWHMARSAEERYWLHRWW